MISVPVKLFYFPCAASFESQWIDKRLVYHSSTFCFHILIAIQIIGKKFVTIFIINFLHYTFFIQIEIKNYILK